jgi:hypothetical protein
MKRIIYVIPILLLTVTVNLMTPSALNAADTAEEKDCTDEMIKTKWITHDNEYHIIGLSPDGKSFYSYKRGDNGNFDLFRHDCATGLVQKTVNLGKHYWPEKTILSWSPDGRYFTLYSWGRYPFSLYIMRGGYIFYVDTVTGSINTVSGERSIRNILGEKGSICYNAVFSNDGRYILYNSWMTMGCDLIRTELGKDNAPVVVYTTPKHEESSFNDLLELSDGYILRNYDPSNPARAKRLVLIDLKTKNEKEIERIEFDKQKQAMFQIKDFSKNRRIVLVNVWRHYPDNPKSDYCEMQILDFSDGYDNPKTMRVAATKGLFIKNGIIARNGTYVVFVEGTIDDPENDRLMLYDLTSKRYSLLFSNKTYQTLTGNKPLNNLGGFAYSPIDSGGGLFISENNDLLVWHASGYFIINLSDIKGVITDK